MTIDPRGKCDKKKTFEANIKLRFNSSRIIYFYVISNIILITIQRIKKITSVKLNQLHCQSDFYGEKHKIRNYFCNFQRNIFSEYIDLIF